MTPRLRLRFVTVASTCAVFTYSPLRNVTATIVIPCFFNKAESCQHRFVLFKFLIIWYLRIMPTTLDFTFDN